MKVGARNQLTGEVVEIKRDEVMCQVTVKLTKTDFHMTSVMTTDSLDELDIDIGSHVNLVVKAVNVMLANKK